MPHHPAGRHDERARTLIASATSDDLREARALLDRDPELARYDLACACATGEADEVARLLAARPATAREPTGPYGWEPILYACFSRLLRGSAQRAPGIRDVVRHLLDGGADPDAAFIHDGNWLQVALYGAAGINGDPDLTEMLLAAGADPTDDRDGYHGNEVLYHACEFADPTCARLVIEAGARQDLVDYDLGRALNFPHPEMVEMFCAHGARAGAGHLHQAVWRRRPPRTVAALLDAGAPIDASDEHELTALQIAVRWGEEDVAQLLRDRGASDTVNADDRALGALVAGRAVSEPVNVVAALFDEMVILAIQGGHADSMGRLLDAGARIDGDPAVPAPPPLGEACWRRRVACVTELVDRGAALGFRGGGSALGATLHGSRHCHHPEGGPTMQTRDEIPAMPYAEIARVLLAAGAVVPARLGEEGPTGATVLADLGIVEYQG